MNHEQNMFNALWMKHNIQIVTELIIIKIPLRLSIERHCICCCGWCCVAPFFHERIKCFFKQKMFIAYKYFIEYKEVFCMCACKCVFFALCFFFHPQSKMFYNTYIFSVAEIPFYAADALIIE